MRYRQVSRNATSAALDAARITEKRRRTQATKEGLVRPVIGSIDELDDEARQFFGKDFRDIYAAGARKADPNWKPSRADVDYVKTQAEKNLRALQLNNEFARRSARRVIPGLVDLPRPEASRLARRRPIKGTTYGNGAVQEFGNYGELVLRSSAARAYNVGFLNAAAAAGKELVIVSDGVDCGWRHHRDLEMASGKVATIEEANAFPIAHPNCVRSFSIAPPGSRPTKGERRKAKEESLASVNREKLSEQSIAETRRFERSRGIIGASIKFSLADTAINVVRSAARDERVQEAARRVFVAGRADFMQYKRNLETVAALYEHARRIRIAEMGNVTNLATAAPPVVSARAVADDVMAWIDDFADGEEVPEHVLEIIGLPKEAERKVVGDRLGGFTQMYNAAYRTAGPVRIQSANIRLPTKVVGRPSKPFDPGKFLLGRIIPPNLTGREQVERFASRAFFNWLGPKIPQAKYLRLTFPNVNKSIGFLDRPVRLSGSIGDFVKVTRTSIKDRGVINHISLNPNGLLRLSLSKDPETGFITPTFRLIPHGPLHIMTRVNRGVQGNITSLSGEVRLIAKAPLVGVSGRFNLNLRKLGLETLADIKKLRLDDYKKFDRDDLRAVSLAADLRLRGWNLFDISRTFRLPWQEGEKLWALTEFELDEIIANLKAINARKKMTLIQGGRVGNLPPPPGAGPVPPRPILRIVDTERGDPFGPGSRPSFAQRIVVPGKLQSVPARRAYIESKMTSTERQRVADLRKAGDFSTIRHLRDRDKLTWEQIAVEMRMTENKVRKIYKEGTGALPIDKTVAKTVTKTVEKPPPGSGWEIVKGLGTTTKTTRPPVAPRRVLKDQEALEYFDRNFGGRTPLDDVFTEGDPTRDALMYYQEDGYSIINTLLRDGPEISPSGKAQVTIWDGVHEIDLEKIVDQIDLIDKSMKPLEEYVEVIREVKTLPVFGVETKDGLVAGQRFGMPGYSSTTVTSDLTRTRVQGSSQFTSMKFVVPRGIRGVWMGDWEKELLLQRGLTVEFVRIDDLGYAIFRVVT